MTRKRLFSIGRVLIPLGILSYLVLDLIRAPASEGGGPTALEVIRSQPVCYPGLAAAFGVALAAFSLTVIRWWMLVRALEIPFSLANAFRLGCLGFLLSFVSVGAVGGDIFKAFFIARESPGRRVRAVASVVVDRVIGLYALFVLASAAILCAPLADAGPKVQTISGVTLALTAFGAIALSLALFVGRSDGRLVRFAERTPRVGEAVISLMESRALYRRRPGVLVISGVMSLAVHALFAVSLWIAGKAVFASTPTMGEHLISVPLSALVGAMPISPAGVGTFELALTLLYPTFSSVEVAANQGVIVAFIYRAFTILIAAIGAVYYVTARREVSETIHAAEAEQ